MRGVEMSVEPLVDAFRIPTLLPPDAFTLGLEYLISFAGLKVSPERISLGAGAEEVFDFANAVCADIVFGWLRVWFAIWIMLYTIIV
jgi:hypothetical protein